MALKIKRCTKNLTSMINESFILKLFSLVLALHSCCGDKKIKYGLQSNHFFQRAQEGILSQGIKNIYRSQLQQ